MDEEKQEKGSSKLKAVGKRLFWRIVIPLIVLGVLALIVYLVGGQEALQDFFE